MKGSRAVYATRVRPLENNVRIQTLLGKLIPFRILYYHTYVLESIIRLVGRRTFTAGNGVYNSEFVFSYGFRRCCSVRYMSVIM